MCFMCYDRKNQEKLQKHMTEVHSASCPMETLAAMCTEAEEKEEREGWSVDDIIEEERERREAAEKSRAVLGGLIGILRGRLGNTDCTVTDAESNADPENVERNCFLCQEKLYLNSNMYNKHLEKKHRVIFGLKEVIINVRKVNCVSQHFMVNTVN